jgi:hypothetical protein
MVNTYSQNDVTLYSDTYSAINFTTEVLYLQLMDINANEEYKTAQNTECAAQLLSMTNIHNHC